MANFYKRPFIYLPRQKKQSGGGITNYQFGGYVEEHITLKSSLGGAMLCTFWTTPQERRTPSVPPLSLYDDVTRKDQMINFSSQWANSSHRLYMMILRLNYTPSNIPNHRWADPHGWWSNTVLPVIFLYVSFQNSDNHLYKISSPDLWNSYRMTPHETNYQLANNNGYIRGVYPDETKYSNIINNQTIQDKIAGYNIYGSVLIYFQQDISDDQMLHICDVYSMPGVTQVEPLTI